MNEPSYQELEARIRELERESSERKRIETELLEKQSILRGQNINLVRKSIELSDIQREFEDKNYELELTRSELRNQNINLVRRSIELSDMMRQFEDKNYDLELSQADLEKALAALRQSEERYRQLVENANDVIYGTDDSGHFSFVNPVAERTTGYSEKEFTGRHYLDLIRPDYRQVAERFYGLQFVKRIPNTYYEFPAVTRDGTELWLGQNVQLVMEDDRVVGFQAVARDITERRRAEEELKKHRDHLEELVEERTAELVRANEQLRQEITKRKQTEEALREINARLQTLIQAIPDVVYFKDAQGRNLVFNRAFEELVGLKRAEIVGKTDEQLLPPDLAEYCRRSDEEAMRSRKPIRFEEESIGEDGEKIFFETVKAPLFDDQGSGAGLVGVSRDITERKRAEEALELKVEQLAALSQASQVVTASLELDQVLAEIVSLASEVVATDYTSVVLVDEAGNIGRSVENLPRVPGMEYRIRDEGLTRWIVHSRQAGVVDEIGEDGVMIPDLGEGAPRFANPPIVESGVKSVAGLPLMVKDRLLGVLYLHSLHAGAFHGQLSLLTTFANQAAIAIDNARLYEALKQELTERKRAEEAVRQLKEFNEGIVQSMFEGIAVEDVEGYFTFVNPAAATLLGYAPEELLGEHWTTVVPPDQQPIVQAADERRRRGETDRYELQLIPKDGARVSVLISGSPRFEEGRFAGTLAVFTDITERKRAEEQIKTSLREKEALLKEIHHRVKNNLQVISSLLYLQSKNIEDEEAFEMFQDSQSRVRSMALVHERLYQSPDLARVDFAEYLRSLANHLFRSYGINANLIQLKINAGDVSLGVDTAIPCGLIISELVSNSLKHAFPDGRGGEVRIELRADDGQLTLMVSDNGVGFPEDLDFRDTGSLGLQLVNMLAEQLEGTIELERSSGTAFELRFAAPYQVEDRLPMASEPAEEGLCCTQGKI